eukprot:scaffold306723_cov22-Tisochrysis_lutea.AAC.1
MGRWWSSLVPIPTGNVEGGPGIEQRHDTRRVEGDACGLVPRNGVHLMSWHQCSEGCSAGFCLWSTAASI